MILAAPTRTRYLTAIVVALVLLGACSSTSRGTLATPTPVHPTATTSSTTNGAHTIREMLRLHAVARPQGGRIVDSAGRDVSLRGVNVNALVEYWSGTKRFPTVFPVGVDDPKTIAGLGFNTVRLLVSWSRVEPQPGKYDDSYLRTASELVAKFAAFGISSIIDVHQDAWGATLAAPDGTKCATGKPALGWDGAPGWATLDHGASRCDEVGIRETTGAVLAAWDAFWTNKPGPGGVGIRSRYVAMLGHLGGYFAADDRVAGFDLMNEPNAFSAPQQASLAAMYGEAIIAIRRAERAANSSPHMILFEPSALWSNVGSGAPPAFQHDSNVVYSPHIYNGGLNSAQLNDASFTTAITEAATFGGAPVLSGEWGSGPSRAADPSDHYFEDHQRLQDKYHVDATLWTWRESCGDPHKVADLRSGKVPDVWGLFNVDCATGKVNGLRQPLANALRRGRIFAAPGSLSSIVWDPHHRTLTASGELGTSTAPLATTLEGWFPCAPGEQIVATTSDGLTNVAVTQLPSGGCSIRAIANANWKLVLAPK